MSKRTTDFDVLVVGDHPAAYVAAVALRAVGQVRVLHVTVPGESSGDRLTLLNPAAFSLSKDLEGLARKIETTPVYGLKFLSHQGEVFSEHRSRSILSHVTTMRAMRDACRALAVAREVTMEQPRTFRLSSVDETGATIDCGREQYRATMLIIATPLAEATRKQLGMPARWDQQSLSQCSTMKLRAGKSIATDGRVILPISLDVAGSFAWGWMLCHAGAVQLSVVHEGAGDNPVAPAVLMRGWVDILIEHGLVKPLEVSEAAVETTDQPLAGALANESVADRTLLIGPAGGFLAATGEELYPSLWSAMIAADVARKALKERHLQDALQPFRSKWRTTLGEYLRGPQQNLRFLLPLVYRNQVMTTRMTEAILNGKSVVR